MTSTAAQIDLPRAARVAPERSVPLADLPSRVPFQGLKGAAMPKRKAVSKRVRFEVFKRDSFKCQYCGSAAPEVLLRVDHIDPVSKGGGNDLLNLITACFDCNAGKSDVALTDDAAVTKQRQQLEALNLRREQMEMMLVWRQELSRLEDAQVDAARQSWEKGVAGWSWNEAGLIKVRKLIKTFGLGKVLDAITIAHEQYIKFEDAKATEESVNLASSKLGGICRLSSLDADERRLYYIRGIGRNRFDWFVDWQALTILKNALYAGVSVSYLEQLTREASSWIQWCRWIEQVTEERRGGDEA